MVLYSSDYLPTVLVGVEEPVVLFYPIIGLLHLFQNTINDIKCNIHHFMPVESYKFS